MPTRILVTGSRECSDEDFIFDTLSTVYEELDDPELVLIHGGARGADTIAGRWVHIMAEDYRVFEEVYPADWDTWGRDAGPIRNAEMLDTQPDLVVAFYKKGAKNAGTNNCVKQARAADIEVWIFHEE